MANPQADDAHLRIAHSIFEAIMTRNFSKMQRSILDFILRLSWGCNKHEAIIPLLKNFENCGVPPTKIKAELEYLANAHVIVWDPYTNRFWFNKNYDMWKISIVRGYSKQVLGELIHLNITSQKSNNVPEIKGSNLPKWEEISLHMGGSNMPQREAEGVLEQPVPTVEGMPKESIIKKVIKDIIILQPYESDFLTVIESVTGYPFDRNKDLTMYGELVKSYPELDLVEAIKDWAIYKIGNQLKPNQDARSQINTSFKNYVKWGKNLKQSNKQSGSIPSGRDYSKLKL